MTGCLASRETPGSLAKEDPVYPDSRGSQARTAFPAYQAFPGRRASLAFLDSKEPKASRVFAALPVLWDNQDSTADQELMGLRVLPGPLGSQDSKEIWATRV